MTIQVANSLINKHLGLNLEGVGLRTILVSISHSEPEYSEYRYKSDKLDLLSGTFRATHSNRYSRSFTLHQDGRLELTEYISLGDHANELVSEFVEGDFWLKMSNNVLIDQPFYVPFIDGFLSLELSKWEFINDYQRELNARKLLIGYGCCPASSINYDSLLIREYSQRHISTIKYPTENDYIIALQHGGIRVLPHIHKVTPAIIDQVVFACILNYDAKCYSFYTELSEEEKTLKPKIVDDVGYFEEDDDFFDFRQSHGRPPTYEEAMWMLAEDERYTSTSDDYTDEYWEHTEKYWEDIGREQDEESKLEYQIDDFKNFFVQWIKQDTPDVTNYFRKLTPDKSLIQSEGQQQKIIGFVDAMDKSREEASLSEITQNRYCENKAALESLKNTYSKFLEWSDKVLSDSIEVGDVNVEILNSIYPRLPKYPADVRNWLGKVKLDDLANIGGLIKRDPSLVEMLEIQTEAYQVIAVDRSADGISWIRNPRPEIIERSLQKHSASIIHIQHMHCENMTELLETAIKRDPDLIKSIYDPTTSLIKLAINNKPRLVEGFPHLPVSYLLEVVEKHPQVLGFIENQTPALCEAAVRASWSSLKYVQRKYKTTELCLVAAKMDERARRYF